MKPHETGSNLSARSSSTGQLSGGPKKSAFSCVSVVVPGSLALEVGFNDGITLVLAVLSIEAVVVVRTEGVLVDVGRVDAGALLVLSKTLY